MKRHISLFLASVVYLGFIPGAPGTYASIMTAFIFYMLSRRLFAIPPEAHFLAICLVVAVGISVSSAVSRDCGRPDPQFIVIDEIAGQLGTFLLLPASGFNIICGVILFRVFDIIKPFPIRRLEHIPGGPGIMADDLMAALYANLILQLANRALHG